ncbi:hypothetical protein MNBD_GAMMA24-2400, partial [hydrothermal vent metagenome]
MQKWRKPSNRNRDVFCTGINRLLFMLFLPLWLVACGGPVIYTSLQHRSIDLKPGDLQHGGIAFITPSSVTGREQDRQSLALSFASILLNEYQDIRVVSLPETLSAVNRANLTAKYKAMFDEYQDTGIFQKDTLRKIGEITGVRYLAQLKLGGFRQESAGRFGFLGLRLMETKRANLRVFLQIWDSQEGSIVWEGLEELNLSTDTFTEKVINFNDIK